jgi:hypothetical protein
LKLLNFCCFISINFIAQEHDFSIAQFKTERYKEFLQGWGLLRMVDYCRDVGEGPQKNRNWKLVKSTWNAAEIHHPRFLDQTQRQTSKDYAGTKIKTV